MTSFELKNNRVKKVKGIFRWALENAEVKFGSKLTAKDEYGMQTLSTGIKETDYKELIEFIDEESVKTLKIELKFEGRECGKRFVLGIDIYKDGDEEVIGGSELYTANNHCNIYALLPEKLEPYTEDVTPMDRIKLSTLGHELLHCFGYDHGEI